MLQHHLLHVHIQQYLLMASPTSFTLAVDSQSNTQPIGAKHRSPRQNLSLCGSQTVVASVGHN